MDFSWSTLFFGIVLGGVLTGFFNAFGGHLWERLHNWYDPPPPEEPPEAPPRERYFVSQDQFFYWNGELLEVYEALSSVGYEFELKVEEEVPAFKTKGWEHMLINDQELWSMDARRTPRAYLIRKPA